MRMKTFRVVLPVFMLFTAACGDDDPMNPMPNPATIPVVSGIYSISSNNMDPSCDATIPAEILDGPITSSGEMEVKQNGASIDMELILLDGDTFSAAEADETSLVGSIDTTGTGMITRTLDGVKADTAGTQYFASQDVSGTATFVVTGTSASLSSAITFTTEYRPDSATAPIQATCTTPGTITGTRN